MGKKLDILTHPNPILRKKSRQVRSSEINTKEMTELAADMIKTMLESDGVGLAAPQVGRNIRLITINTKDGCLVMFNPVISKKSIRKETCEEGCLSVPGYFGEVKRPKSVNCIFTGLDGSSRSIIAEGLLARIIQHEIDHLDGILFIDSAGSIHELKK